jgi:hypothetical protein
MNTHNPGADKGRDLSDAAPSDRWPGTGGLRSTSHAANSEGIATCYTKRVLLAGTRSFPLGRAR